MAELEARIRLDGAQAFLESGGVSKKHELVIVCDGMVLIPLM